MVRNNKGGKNGKKLARKHIKTEQQGTGPKKARVPEQDGETFACAIKMLGNATVLVVDLYGNEYICIIRKKFKGRGKRGNTIQKGTWLLVGKRSFECEIHTTSNNEKKMKCDLLEVYNDKEKQLLKQQCSECKWGRFDSYNDEVADIVIQEGIEFINEQDEYRNMIVDISDNDSLPQLINEEECARSLDVFGNTINPNKNVIDEKNNEDYINTI